MNGNLLPPASPKTNLPADLEGVYGGCLELTAFGTNAPADQLLFQGFGFRLKGFRGLGVQGLRV